MDRFKRIIALVLMSVMLCAGVPTIYAQNQEILYVSPNGNDSASGTVNSPLKTLAGAKKRVSELKSAGKTVKEVIFREGEYRMRTVSFTQDDSGTEESPIVYKAYDGEKVAFKGSVTLDITKAKPVTDELVAKRIHSKAEGKLIQIDLKEQGISQSDILDTSLVNANSGLRGNNDYNTIFIDGRELELAQWPNGDNYVVWEQNGGNKSFRYKESEPARWVNAKNWWVGTFPDYDFNYFTTSVQSLDIQNRVIEVTSKAAKNFTSPYSKRWKAFNLLEELDMPGEFYIDRDAMMLYMYPPYTLAGSKVELSVGGYGSGTLIEGTNLSHVTFEGLEFSQTVAMAANMVNAVNVDFIECTFKNIGNIGVSFTGTKEALTGKSGPHVNTIIKNDGSYDVDIKGCVFDTVGHMGIYMQGGNIDTLTSSRNVVENNFFTCISSRYFSNVGAVLLTGCGTVFRQNTITHSRQHGVTYQGNNITIEQNEIYDVLRDVGDAGAIYTGRSQLQRGNVVSQNFVHQITCADPRVPTGTCGIYSDDGCHGNTIKENIIVGAQIGYNNNGASALGVLNNIIIGSEKHWAFHNFKGYSGEKVTVSAMGTLDDLINDIADKELYYKEYPLLKRWATTQENPKKQTKIDGNLIVGDSVAFIGDEDEKYPQWGKNIQVSETDAFVDAENRDYRLKKDSDLAKELPGVLTEDFDIEQIGTQQEFVFNEKTSPFRLLYPQNGARISSVGVQLSWQEAFGANSYHVTVAKDAKFNNIVYDETVRYNFVDLGDLDKKQRYYWKVTALNTSRAFASEWKHDGAVYTFTTNAYDKLNTENFEFVAADVEEMVNIMSEGTTPGTFKVGTGEYIKRYIDVTKALTKLPLGKYSQANLDERTEFISNYYNLYAQRNIGFVDLMQYDDESHWSPNLIRDDVNGSMTLTAEGSSAVGGSQILSGMAGSVIYCFDVVMENDDGSFMILGMSKNISMQYEGRNNGYTVVTKSNMLELQKQDGSKNAVIDVREGVTLNDGAKHSVMFGYLNTTVGCNVLLVVDGEIIFNYADVTATAQRGQAMEFVTTARPNGAKVVYSKSENIPGNEEFAKLLKYMEYQSAQAIVKSFPDVAGAKLLKAGSKKVITDAGVFDVSYATPEMKNEKLMVPVSIIAKMFDGTSSLNGNSATLNIRNTEFSFADGKAEYTIGGVAKAAAQTPYMKNGHLMVALEDVVAAIGCGMTGEWMNNVVIITDSGTANVANQGQEFRNAATILEKLSTFEETDDFYFEQKTEAGGTGSTEEELLDAPVEADTYVAFLGDSITRDGTYISYIDAFLKTRFPDKKINLINAGKDGDRALDGFDRLKEDVIGKKATKVFICFGMNDAARVWYPNVGSAAQKAASIANAQENLEKIVVELNKNGITDITLITPPTYDDRTTYVAKDAAGALVQNFLGFGDALAKVSANVEALAKKYDIKFIDINSITDDILDRAETAGEGKEEIIKYDRIHPNQRGHFVIAAAIIEAMYSDYSVVGSVDIDVSSGVSNAQNASVSEVSVANGGVSYKYQAKSLPMGADSGYRQAEERYGRPASGADDGKYVEFTDKMNREIIKVTNLAAGSYTVSFDGVALGTYTADELAQGINIATNAKNPGQIQAKEILDNCMWARSVITTVRSVENDITALKNAGKYEGYSKEAMVEWLNNNPVGTANGSSLEKHYDNLQKYYRQIWTYEAKAYDLAKTKAYTVTITPVK